MLPLLALAGYFVADFFMGDDEGLMQLDPGCDPLVAPCTLSDEDLTVKVTFDGDLQFNYAFTLYVDTETPLDSVTVGFSNGSISEGLSKPFPVPYDAGTGRWKLDVDLAENVRGAEEWNLLLVMRHDRGRSFGEVPFEIKRPE